MPTTREIKKLLRPLLSRRSDLVTFRRSICFVPFTRYLRGVTFKLSMFSTHSQIMLFASQLCSGAPDVDFFPHEWAEIPENWEDDVEGTSQRLCDELEKSILPTIEPVTSFEEHLKRFPESLHVYSPDSESDRHKFQLSLTLCTRGEFDKAEAVMTKLLDPANFFYGVPEVVTEEHRFSGIRQEQMAYLLMTLRKGRAETLTLLHDWETYMAKTLKLEKHWQQLPFPCEL